MTMLMEPQRPCAHAPRAAVPRERKAAIFQRASRLVAAWLLGSAFFSTSIAMSNPLDVVARIQQQDQKLHIEWTVKNTGNAPLWVMYDQLRKPKLYVQPGPAGTLEFSIKAFALPPGVMVTTYQYLDLQELKPGAQWQAAEEMTLPLMASAAYGHFNANKPLPADARKARLCIGFLTQAPDNLSPMFKRPDGTLRLPHGSGLVKAQKLACSPVVTW